MNRASPLSWRVKAGYGATDLGLAAVETLLSIYLLNFYNVVIGLPATYTSIALAIAILWDALSDPLMGGISDRTCHATGRRRPYILPGAFALALFFAAIFNPPSIHDPLFQFCYLLTCYVLLNTALTVVAVPHAALGGELSFDRDERTEIFGYKRAFDTVGALLGLLLPAGLLAILNRADTPENIAQSRHLVGVALTLPLLVTAAITVRVTRGLDHPASRVGETILANRLREMLSAQVQALHNPLFGPLIAAFIIVAVGRAINASLALYYYQFSLQLTEQQAVIEILLPFFLSFLAFIPLWIFISRKQGKKWPAIVGLAILAISTSAVYPLFPSGDTRGPLVYALFAGPLVGAVILLDALVPDIVDYDQLKTGRNRQGLYFGVWKMTTKISRALGLLLSGLMLDAIGFDETAVRQTPEVARALSLLFGPVVGGFFLAGCGVLACMPLTDAKHRRIQRLLRKRRTL